MPRYVFWIENGTGIWHKSMSIKTWGGQLVYTLDK